MEPMVAVFPVERNSEWSRWWQSFLLRGTVSGADGGSLILLRGTVSGADGGSLILLRGTVSGADGGSLSF